jgi:hypothetical protein
VQILDYVIQKRHGYLLNKHIKSAFKSNSHYINIKNSAINPSDPNLYVCKMQQQKQ